MNELSQAHRGKLPGSAGQARALAPGLLLSLSAAALLMGFLAAGCAGSPPDIGLSRPQLDLGEVVNGEVLTVEARVHNEGGTRLVIEAVTTSCGCTSAEVWPAVIEPGESGLLMVTYDSGAHGPEANGPVMRQVFIASNDPDEPEVAFRITAEVLPPDS